MIPLFAIGVFIGFTLAQTGLVRHWFTHHGRWWAGRASLNGLGAVLSAAAAVIFLATKFVHGAFIIVIVIPGLIVLFRRIHRYYDTLGTALATSQVPPALEIGAPGLVLVPVIDISRLTSVVLARALELGGEVRALHAAFEGEPTDALEARWQTWGPGVPLIVVPSPQRSVVHAFLAYLATPEVAAHHETSWCSSARSNPASSATACCSTSAAPSSPPRSAGAPTLSSPPSHSGSNNSWRLPATRAGAFAHVVRRDVAQPFSTGQCLALGSHLNHE